MATTLKIISPAAGSTVTAGVAGQVVVELCATGFWDKVYALGLSARVSIRNAQGNSAKAGSGSFSASNATIPITWPSQPGSYTLEAQGQGKLGFDNAVDTIGFTVAAPVPTVRGGPG